MDLSKFKTSDWLKVGGSAAVLIFGLTSWASAGGTSGGNAFDFFFTGTIPWLLIVAAGVITVLLKMDVIKSSGIPWNIVLLAAFVLGALLIVIRLLIGPKIEVCFGNQCTDVELDRGFGLILSAVGAVAAAVGAVLGFKESGGDLSDLTDMNKLKGQFGGGAPGGGTPPPPPPPPGMTPPPPPPPPMG